ncbi:MAG TPA: GntR family transcriptional regulator [Nocardioides sp.]|nr:GntR family transcriptional regulator [Nocardioides sp.]
MTASHLDGRVLPDLTRILLRPVGGHAFESCVEQLATAIRLGVYPLGTTLPSERELAERMKVSRSTLREAMAALRAADLVQTSRGRGGGTVVTMKPQTPSARRAARTTPEQRARWLDALVFRRAVEPAAAYQAAAADLGPEARARLEAAHETVAGATSRARHRQADSRFHLILASLTGSPRIVEAVTSVQACLHEMLSAIPVLEANIAHSDRQHQAILRSVLDGRSEKARRTMEEHCDDTAALLRGLLG